MKRLRNLLALLLLPVLLTGGTARPKPKPADVYGRIQFVDALPGER